MTFTQRATNLILAFISSVGLFLVGEQIITGEQLAEVQGVVGMALSGGGFSVLTVLYIFRTLVPKQVADNIVANVGADKVEKVFNTIDEVYNELQSVRQELLSVKEELALNREEREAIKTDLGL